MTFTCLQSIVIRSSAVKTRDSPARNGSYKAKVGTYQWAELYRRSTRAWRKKSGLLFIKPTSERDAFVNCQQQVTSVVYLRWHFSRSHTRNIGRVSYTRCIKNNTDYRTAFIKTPRFPNRSGARDHLARAGSVRVNSQLNTSEFGSVLRRRDAALMRRPSHVVAGINWPYIHRNIPGDPSGSLMARYTSEAAAGAYRRGVCRWRDSRSVFIVRDENAENASPLSWKLHKNETFAPTIHVHVHSVFTHTRKTWTHLLFLIHTYTRRWHAGGKSWKNLAEGKRAENASCGQTSETLQKRTGWTRTVCALPAPRVSRRYHATAAYMCLVACDASHSPSRNLCSLPPLWSCNTQSVSLSLFHSLWTVLSRRARFPPHRRRHLDISLTLLSVLREKKTNRKRDRRATVVFLFARNIIIAWNDIHKLRAVAIQICCANDWFGEMMSLVRSFPRCINARRLCVQGIAGIIFLACCIIGRYYWNYIACIQFGLIIRNVAQQKKKHDG